jgi:hypothetical protein
MLGGKEHNLTSFVLVTVIVKIRSNNTLWCEIGESEIHPVHTHVISRRATGTVQINEFVLKLIHVVRWHWRLKRCHSAELIWWHVTDNAKCSVVAAVEHPISVVHKIHIYPGWWHTVSTKGRHIVHGKWYTNNATPRKAVTSPQWFP